MKKKQVLFATAVSDLQVVTARLTAELATINERVQVLEDGKNGAPIAPALAVKRDQVRELMVSGTVNKVEILQLVWNAKPGSSEKYKLAEQEFKTIMAHIAQG